MPNNTHWWHFVRFLTAVVIITLCSVSVVLGWNIVTFSTARAHVGGTDKATVPVLYRWVGIAGLTVAALEASLEKAPAADLDANGERVHALSALLSARPLSAADWLSLASMRLAAGASHGQVVTALNMSCLTGPNEGGLIWQRGMLGLLEWDFLPSDAKNRTIRDLESIFFTVGLVDDEEATLAKRMLDTKSPQTRREIIGLLQEDGREPAELARLGLINH